MHILRIAACLCVFSIALVEPRPAHAAPPLAGLAQNDLVYESPAREGWQGLPLGNGKWGAQVWQPGELVFQLNADWGGPAGVSLGRLRLRTTPDMLADVKRYRQRLSLPTATLFTDIETATGAIQIKAWMSRDTNALVIEVDDRRTGDVQHVVEIESWRPATMKNLPQPNRLVLNETLVTGYERPLRDTKSRHYQTALVVETNPEIAVTTEVADANLSRMKIGGKKYVLYAAFADSHDPDRDGVATAATLLESCRTAGAAAIYAAHTASWADFWSRSYLQLSSSDGTANYLANLWYLHVYAMSACSRGDVVPKFNGGFWTDDKDAREWGAGYWHWNTQEMYWPLYAANHLPLNEPYYSMYFQMLARVKQQTKDYFGIEGAHFGETVVSDGGDASGKGPKKEGVHPRLPVPATPAFTNLVLSSSGEIAMQFWWRYLYTGDRDFLEKRAYPLMRAVAEFYLAYLEKGPDGRYFMYPSNAHETFLAVKNPVTDLAAIRYLLQTLLRASELLNVDAEMRPLWQDRLTNLAPWPMNTEGNTIAPFERRPNEDVKATNAENPELFSVGVFPLITLGSPDFELGVRTFQARVNRNGYGWTTDSICAARLGLRDDLQKQMVAQVNSYQDHPSGLMDYYGRKPALHPYLEASGALATGIGEMLLQSWPKTAAETEPVIRACPALPTTFDARFKLLAIGGFLVEAVAEKGQVRTMAITSTRGGSAHVANPFGKETSILLDNREVLRSSDAILTLATEAGKTYVLAAAGDVPVALGPAELPANEAAKPFLDKTRWLGIPATSP